MTYVVCGIFLLIPLVFLWLVVTNVFDAFRKPLIRRYGEKFRIVKVKKLVENSWNEKIELEEQYRLEVYTLGFWIMYDWWKSTAMCENDIQEIKKWRLMREEAKEAKNKKEVIKEEKL